MSDAESAAAPVGVVEEVSGPVVDVACGGALPGMHDALRVELDGGECVLDLARSGADVRAVVSYHGLLTTERPAAQGAIKAHVAVYAGAEDPYAPPEHIAGFGAEMTAGNVNGADDDV